MVGSKSLQTKTTNNPNGSSTINTRSNMNIGLHPHIADPDNYNLYWGNIKGNIRIISNRANRIKADATIEELRKVLEDYERISS